MPFLVVKNALSLATSKNAANDGYQNLPIPAWAKLLDILDTRSREFTDFNSASTSGPVRMITKFLDTYGDRNSSTYLWCKQFLVRGDLNSQEDFVLDLFSEISSNYQVYRNLLNIGKTTELARSLADQPSIEFNNVLRIMTAGRLTNVEQYYNSRMSDIESRSMNIRTKTI